ncbi:hypothetical protein QLQ12_16030 [Actinoplanes sp. NEAU-A12]|uniref:Lipoprotein n=1 Tax=Actinoplanes sandaracinus TaxID=3045177 RepID=A0ABT6WK43_9ACTN|nr:hypothetical protein [Actinoplanes sandaracinus]MDI6100112.1 hypothetical protein [Actinoplanes sandaracinus]
MTTVKSYRLALPLAAALLSTGCISLPLPEAPEPSPRPTYPIVVDEFTPILERTRASSYAYSVDGTLPGGKKLAASGAFDAKAKRLVSKLEITPGSLQSGYQEVRANGKETWIKIGAMDWQSRRGFDLTDPTGLNSFAEAIQDVRLAGPNLYWVYVKTDSNVVQGYSFLPIGAPGTVSAYSPLGGAIRVNVTTDGAGLITSFVIEADSDGQKHRLTTTLSGHGQPVIVPVTKR